jgi:hypothetical protein
MVPDAWVYRAADRLIRQHGADALEEVNRLICDALDHRDRGRALLWCASGWRSELDPDRETAGAVS